MAVKFALEAPRKPLSQMNDRELARWAREQGSEWMRAGQTAYDTGNGVWFGRDSDGTVKVSFGDSAGNKVTWDGSTLAITGTITATLGEIGGWTLGATYLTAGTAGTTVRLDSGGTNPAISAGSATPASAPFRVTQAGALTATSGAIGGWTLAATYLESGSGATLVRVDSGGTNPAFSAGSATPASAPFRVTQGGALTATSATITGAVTATSGSFTGGVTIGTSGSLSSGQSAYDTGTGYWLEYNGGTPRLSLGNSAGNKLTWNGTTLAITGSITLTNSASTFTPAWTGFSADPSGDISYSDFGTEVVMFIGAQLTGTSNTTAMSITNVPSGIRPSSARFVASCVLVDNGTVTHVGGADVATDGTLTFGLQVTNVVANRVNTSNTAFTNSGSKGLSAGWMIRYPK